MCKKLNLVNCLCFPCLEKLTAKFPVFPLAWPRCCLVISPLLPENALKFCIFVIFFFKVIYLAVKAVGNKVEIDLETSVEVTKNPALGRIAQSFTQLEERLERERIEKVEKERKIRELQMNYKLVFRVEFEKLFCAVTMAYCSIFIHRYLRIIALQFCLLFTVRCITCPSSRQPTENASEICSKHAIQGMELNLYCIQCDLFICHLCANKHHQKHGVIAASCKEEYTEKRVNFWTYFVKCYHCLCL